MNAEKDKVVSIDYTLRNDDGDVMDSSKEAGPLDYLHGHGNIIPGLEEAVAGKGQGDHVEVSVPAEKAYGEYNDQLVMPVPKDRFQGIEDIQPGMQFQAQTQNGGMQIVTVKDVGDEEVTVDANHPLAGETLHFEVDVVNVRDAEDEEKEHGHVHKEGEDHG